MIEFQYFEGCPNAKTSLDNLLEIKQELNIHDNQINIMQLPDVKSAEKNNFQGSPTILIDGVDIYNDSKPTGYNYSCRVYFFDGIQTGVIPKEFIKEKILKYLKG
jgi:hypothetical protein